MVYGRTGWGGGGGNQAGASTVEKHRLHEPNDQYAGMVDKFIVVIKNKKRITWNAGWIVMKVPFTVILCKFVYKSRYFFNRFTWAYFLKIHDKMYLRNLFLNSYIMRNYYQIMKCKFVEHSRRGLQWICTHNLILGTAPPKVQWIL